MGATLSHSDFERLAAVSNGPSDINRSAKIKEQASDPRDRLFLCRLSL
jgi:hypothetical protein